MKDHTNDLLRKAIADGYREMIIKTPGSSELFEKAKKELGKVLKMNDIPLTEQSLNTMIEGIRMYLAFHKQSPFMGEMIQGVLVTMAEDFKDKKEEMMKNVKI